MTVRYEEDVVAWAWEQAALLRAGKLSALDIEHIAEEIEDVGKSEQRELANRMAVLIAHLLKWKFQPLRRGASWAATINAQRAAVARRLRKTPSLRVSFDDPEWQADAWADGVTLAAKEMGLDDNHPLPHAPIWSMDQMVADGFLPD
jgi:hypothetical protein